MTVDIDHLRTWIGRSEVSEDIVTPRLVAEYQATFETCLAPVGAGEAPLALQWCLAPPIAPMSLLGPDGHPSRGGFLPPVPLPNRMWAGGTIETRGPLKVGDRVEKRSVIEDVTVKEGRSGPLCFVAVRHTYDGGRGPAVIERHDIVYRDPAKAPPAPADAAAAPSPAPRQADLAWAVAATPVLLFRYSAMTFNGHRIHYDFPYVTGAEGYRGLVVHGPIQATLLFNLVSVLGGRPPASFRYRGLSPLIAGATFRIAGTKSADGTLSAWTEDAGGRICMEAEARP